MTVIIVYSSAVLLTSLLARTPLAVPLTGRKQVPWSTLIPREWRREPTAAVTAGPEPVAVAVAGPGAAGVAVAGPGAAGVAVSDVVGPEVVASRLPGAATLAGMTDNQNGT